LQRGEATAPAWRSKSGNFALPVCLAAMDGCWMYLVAWFVGVVLLRGIEVHPVPSPLVLAALELVSWWLYGYLARSTRLAMSGVQGVWVVGGLACTAGLLLADNPTFNGSDPFRWAGTSAYAVIAGLTLWFVGGYRAYKPQGSDTPYTNFRAAIIAVSVVGLFTMVVARQYVVAELASIGAITVWFFVWAMCALILGTRELVREGSGKIDSGSWGLVSVASMAVVTVVGFMGGGFGAQDPLLAVQKGVTAVAALLGLLIYGILYPIFWLMSLFGVKIGPRREAGVPNENMRDWGDVDRVELARREVEARGADMGIPRELVGGLTWLAIVVVALAIVLLIGRVARRRQQQMQRSVEERRESLGVRSRLGQQMAGWARRILSRFRRAADVEAAVPGDDLGALAGRPEWSGSLTVRQIYVRLQVVAGRLGYPRAPQETPVEYLSVLSRAMPGLTADLECVTRAYIEARYSPLPVTGPAVVAANEAWKRLEAGFRSAGGAAVR
jgi:Domain of unknown function (DUF4129)